MKYIIFLLVSISYGFAGDYQIHILKEGETLSEILLSHGYTPLYGKDQWVQKALEMNHLKSIRAKEIKKGYPIILPHKTSSVSVPGKTYRERIISPPQINSISKLKQKDRFNTISKHQDVFFNFSYAKKNIELPSSSLLFDENITAGVQLKGKNNYHYKELIYNFNAELQVTTHGAGKVLHDSSKSLRVKPSYSLDSSLSLNSKYIPFHFGPTLSIIEKSLVEQLDDSINTRRDQYLFLGFQIAKTFKLKGILYHANMSYGRKMFLSSLTDGEDFETAYLKTQLSINLTRNYKAGLYFSAVNYDQIELDSEKSTGINFSYLIK